MISIVYGYLWDGYIWCSYIWNTAVPAVIESILLLNILNIFEWYGFMEWLCRDGMIMVLLLLNIIEKMENDDNNEEMEKEEKEEEEEKKEEMKFKNKRNKKDKFYIDIYCPVCL